MVMPSKPPIMRRARQTKQQRDKTYDDKRVSRSKRGYDRTWYRLRDIFLREHPLCEMDCKDNGLIVAATVVDHIIPIMKRPDLRLVESNLRAACKPCHDRRTAKEQGFARPGDGGRGRGD